MTSAKEDFGMQRSILWLGMFMSVLFIGGCSLGPQVLKGNRYDYNLSIQKSNNEELILNIVRARYAESIFFLQVGSISSHFGYSTSIGLSSTLPSGVNQPTPSPVRPNLGVTFSENPTITYTPMQGEEVVRLLQSDLTLDRFMILTSSGWDIESIMWLVVDKIGDLKNFEVDMLTGKPREENYDKYLNLVQLLNQIQKRGDLEFVGYYRKEGVVNYLSLQFRFLNHQEADQVEGLLKVRPDRIAVSNGRIISTIELTSVSDFVGCRQTQGKCSQVPIKLKSFFDILRHLSFYVDIPPDEQAQQKIVRPFKPMSNDIKHRDGFHKGSIRVKSQWTYPDNAYIAIPYRNRWFYLADDDVQSKIYFSLVKSIFSLQSGNLQAVVPILTIPVGH